MYRDRRRLTQAGTRRCGKQFARRVYCGAFQFRAEAIRALAHTEGLNDILSADVIHHIENGELAHSDLRIVLKPGQIDTEGTKTGIVDRLWNVGSGPLLHRCDCDTDIDPHPSANLDAAPAGPYVDTRRRYSVLLCLIRFHIVNWLWQKPWRVGYPHEASECHHQ